VKVLPSGIYYGKKHPFEDCPSTIGFGSVPVAPCSASRLVHITDLSCFRPRQKPAVLRDHAFVCTFNMNVDTKIDTIFVGGGADPPAVV